MVSGSRNRLSNFLVKLNWLFVHTKHRMVNIVGFWLIGLPTSGVLAFHFGFGPRGLWWGLTLGLASVALLFILRIRVRFAGAIARVSPE